MKNGMLVWNVILTLVAGYLLIAQFTRKTDVSVNKRGASIDSTHSADGFRIAYFEMDSVENNFDMVKDVKGEIGKKEEEYNNGLASLDTRYRNRYTELMQKAKTQADADAAQNTLRALADQLKAERQEMDQQYQDFVMRRNLNVKKTIEDFLAGYNKTKNYSYIMAHEPGLFYYRDTAYNITGDLIRGLNEQYRKKK